MLEKLEQFRIETANRIHGGFTATDDLSKWRKTNP